MESELECTGVLGLDAHYHCLLKAQGRDKTRQEQERDKDLD